MCARVSDRRRQRDVARRKALLSRTGQDRDECLFPYSSVHVVDACQDSVMQLCDRPDWWKRAFGGKEKDGERHRGLRRAVSVCMCGSACVYEPTADVSVEWYAQSAK